MRIPDQLLKSVGFVSRDEMQFDFRASAFVVSVPHDERYGVMHLVTAKHVAARLQLGQAIIGMNGRDGHPIWLKNQLQVPWFFHPDETVDVAILPMATAIPRDYDYQDISTNMFLTPERLLQFGIGVGDETFNIGLFTPFIGELRLTPIVRTDIIAMMPKSRIPHPVFGSMEAYLAEGRSIGGLSGSPVFVRDTMKLQVANQAGEKRSLSALGDFHLLGLLSGHWNAIATESSANFDLNTGISIIVPAQKILEALSSPELIALRDEAISRGLAPGR